MLSYKRKAVPDFVKQVRQAYLNSLAASVRRDLERLKAEQVTDRNDAGLESLISEAEDLLKKIQEKKAA